MFSGLFSIDILRLFVMCDDVTIRMCLFLFALLFRFDKKLFYPFVLRTISTFNRYAYCVVARSVVNIQHPAGCLLVCFPGMTSLLPKVNRSSGAHFQTFFSTIFLFFDLPQYSDRFDYIRDRRRAIYFNNQKIIAYHL